MLSLEERARIGIGEFFTKESSHVASYLAKKIVEGFEIYLTDLGNFGFLGFRSREGLFASDILGFSEFAAEQNDPSRKYSSQKLEDLAGRGQKYGYYIMETELFRLLGVDPMSVSKKVLKDRFADIYSLYTRWSKIVMGEVAAKNEQNPLPAKIPGPFSLPNLGLVVNFEEFCSKTFGEENLSLYFSRN